MITAMNFHMNNNANAMTFEQQDIDRFNAHDYSMFLAYGDTFRDLSTESTGEGSNQFWEAEATRLIERAGSKKLFVSERVRCSFNQRMPTIRYPRDSDIPPEDSEG